MVLRNCKLIDPEQGIFSFLDLVTFRLSGPYTWQNDDYNSDESKVSVFRAYEHDGDTNNRRDVASITIADATLDPTEPDIAPLQVADVPALDQLLLEGTHAQLTGEGRELVRWMSSQLNQTDCMKALVTPYIISDQGVERQSITLRLSSKGRKFVVVGVFDISQKDALASLIFGVIHGMVVLQ
jgi:hypothetical protein